MDQHLHGLFERAAETEPLGPPEDVARAAMAQGRRLRRRRHLATGGGVVVLVAGLAAAVTLAVGPPPGAPVAAPASPGCASPVPYAGTNVYLLLRTDATEQQRIDLSDALHADTLVRESELEDANRAFERFKRLWDEPGRSAGPPERRFRVELYRPDQFTAFVAQFQDRPGVADVVGAACLGVGE